MHKRNAGSTVSLVANAYKQGWIC